jgi:hypothetical protein
MRALVLFCGTGSVDRALERAGFEVVSLDINAKFNPTHVADILEWDFRQYPKGHFDFCWGSPCCTHFSRARTTAKTPRDIAGATALVAKTLEIFEYFGCPWALENPQTGLLKEQPIMTGIPFKDVTYCKYQCADWSLGYRKGTRIWNSLGDAWQPCPVCCKASPCEAFARLGHHPMTAQRRPGTAKGALKPADSSCSLEQLYSMPPTLCDQIASAAAVLANADQQ